MNIFGHHIIVLNDEQHAIVAAVLSDAGHTVVSAGESAISALWAETKTKFPELIADIEKGIADAKDSTLSGGDKAVKVATDVLASAPDVIKALPQAKDFLVHGVTEVFAAGEAALIAAAKSLLGKL
jgi:hypothetical protein